MHAFDLCQIETHVLAHVHIISCQLVSGTRVRAAARRGHEAEGRRSPSARESFQVGRAKTAAMKAENRKPKTAAGNFFEVILDPNGCKH